jgi:hypothetical protein
VAGDADLEGGAWDAGVVECRGWWRRKRETASMVSFSAAAPTAAAGVLSSASGRLACC